MLRMLALTTLIASPVLAQEKTFDFTGIDSIDARNGVNVTVIPGDEVTVTATALKGDVDQLTIRKFGPWLALNRNTRWFIFPFGRTDEIEVTITLPELRNLKAFESATASASGFSGDGLRAEAIDGGTVNVTNVEITDVTLVATGAGDLTVTGSCETLVAQAMFSASIAATGLTCENAAATARSNASLTATATTLASIEEVSGGTVSLSGAPEVVDYLPGMEPEMDDATPEG